MFWLPRDPVRRSRNARRIRFRSSCRHSLNAIETGLIESLARPDGNVTGSTSFARELAVKRLEWLKAALPRLQRAGVLVHPDTPATAGLLQALEDAARSLKVQLQVVEARTSADFDRAFASLLNGRADGLVITDHTTFVSEATRLAQLAGKTAIPTIGFVEIADGGGLLAYGVDFPALWHRAASFADNILKGAKPSDLPVQQPTKFEFVVNLRAAKALAITVSPSVTIRADRIVE